MSFEIKLLALLAIVAGALFGFNRFVASEQAKGAAACEARHIEADHDEFVRRESAQLEIANDAQKNQDRRTAESVGAVVAGNGLRQRAASAIGFDLAASAPAVGSPAPEATRVCAQLLEQADQRLRILAAAADASHDAGAACERTYDALTPSSR